MPKPLRLKNIGPEWLAIVEEVVSTGRVKIVYVPTDEEKSYFVNRMRGVLAGLEREGSQEQREMARQVTVRSRRRGALTGWQCEVAMRGAPTYEKALQMTIADRIAKSGDVVVDDVTGEELTDDEALLVDYAKSVKKGQLAGNGIGLGIGETYIGKEIDDADNAMGEG